MFYTHRESGVQHFVEVLQENGWCDASGSMWVYPHALDRAEFDACVNEHYNEGRQLLCKLLQLCSSILKCTVLPLCNTDGTLKSGHDHPHFITHVCRFVIVDGHHRYEAIIRMRVVNGQLVPISVSATTNSFTLLMFIHSVN
jgi:hypothetical protein